jgi:hypothetical protein
MGIDPTTPIREFADWVLPLTPPKIPPLLAVGYTFGSAVWWPWRAAFFPDLSLGPLEASTLAFGALAWVTGTIASFAFLFVLDLFHPQHDPSLTERGP